MKQIEKILNSIQSLIDEEEKNTRKHYSEIGNPRRIGYVMGLCKARDIIKKSATNY